PAELGHLFPHRVVVAARVVPRGAHGGRLAVLVEERACGVLQELLVGREPEVHGSRLSPGRRGSPWADRARARRSRSSGSPTSRSRSSPPATTGTTWPTSRPRRKTYPN